MIGAILLLLYGEALKYSKEPSEVKRNKEKDFPWQVVDHSKMED